jgi:phosphatidate cytidylyltransferase
MNLREEQLRVFVSVTAVLLLASLIAFILQLRVRDPDAQLGINNLAARIRAWWIMLIIVGGALLAGERAFIALFAFLSMAALREFSTLTSTRRADYGALFLCFFVALPIQYGLIWVGWYGLFAVLIPVYAFLILPIASVVFADHANFLARTSETQWGLTICVFCLSHVPALLTLRIPGYSDHAALLVIFLLVVTESSDVLQYIFGKLFGRHKIAPEISPSKTVEGFIGGVATSTLLGAGLWRLTPFNPWQAAVMALTITLMGFLGGLVMSAIKRDRGVKDWGHLIPGHGGMLDRLDSLAFSAPIFFHLTRYFFAG